MSDGNIPTGGTNPRSTSATTSAIDIVTTRVNVAAVIACVLLVIAGIKLTSFLPERLYFSFSRVVSGSDAQLFLIPPPYLTEEQACDALRKNKEIKELKCAADETGDKPEDENTAANLDKEKKIADREVRQAANSQGTLDSVLALLIRLAIPFIAGFLISRFFPEDGITAAGVGAALAALLLCWPVIVLWDRVVTGDWHNDYGKFIALYVLYMVLFFFVGRLGAMAGTKFSSRPISFQINTGKIIETVTGSIISGLCIKMLERAILS